MVKNQIHLSEEQLRNIIAENVKKALSEDFGAGMRAVGSRLKNDVGGMFGKPSFGREYYGGSYKDTFKDASMESDYWKLGKELESGIVKDNPIVILDKVKKFAEYGVISQESCKKILGLIKRGNYQEAGHELCYGTMSFVAGEDEVGATDYERRHSIRQLEESQLRKIVAESVKNALNEISASLADRAADAAHKDMMQNWNDSKIKGKREKQWKNFSKERNRRDAEEKNSVCPSVPESELVNMPKNTYVIMNGDGRDAISANFKTSYSGHAGTKEQCEEYVKRFYDASANWEYLPSILSLEEYFKYKH